MKGSRPPKPPPPPPRGERTGFIVRDERTGTLTRIEKAKPPPPPKLKVSKLARLRPVIRMTIGAKLVSLIALLLVGAIGSVVLFSTGKFAEDNRELINQMNADTASNLAAQMREQFESITEKMRVLGTIILQEDARAEQRDRLIAEFFSKDKEFLAVFVHRGNEVAARAISPELMSSNDLDGSKAAEGLGKERDFSLAQALRGEVQIATTKLADGSPVIAIGVPFIQLEGKPGLFTHTVTSLVRQARFVRAFAANDIVTSFMTDRRGKVLAHSELQRNASGENVSYLEIVKVFMEGKTGNTQKAYVDPQSGDEKLGAFRTVGFGGAAVFAEVPAAKALETSRTISKQAVYFSVAALCFAFLVGYLFSFFSISRPIGRLVEAAHRISEGDFAINLKTSTSKDEMAHLSNAFNEMARGLEERDRVKETFNKFHNKEIAEKLLSGEVKLGGERKEATVFFSDVRGFTAMSETMEPEQVVEMLNEYMTRMVSIIRAHGGVVDKYVGDAIMALWGVPIAKPDDTYNAVKACLQMRKALAELNELRQSRGQNVLKIGMGLNRGPLIAGNIGSDEKMEYTVIGDAVNTASRMESMTKEYGTDLLCPRSIYDEVQGRFLFEQAKSARVKGKAAAIEVFTVKGWVGEDGRDVVIETPYSSYAAEKSDKGVHEETTESPTHAPVAPPRAPPPKRVASAPVPPPPPPPPEEDSATRVFVLEEATNAGIPRKKVG